MNIVDFINEFERLCNNIETCDMELPTGVLGCTLLKSVDISEDKQQLARATISMFMYDDTKKSWKQYDNLSTNRIKASTTKKVEPTHKVTTYEKPDRFDGYFNRDQSNAYKGSRGRGYHKFRKNNLTSD